MKSQDLKERRKALLSELREVNSLAETEDRDLSADEQKAWDAKEAEIAGLDKRIERQEAIETEERIERASNRSTGVVTDEDRVADIKVGENRVALDPKRGFKTHREFLSAVMRAMVPGGKEAEGLRTLRTVGSDEGAVASDAYGGYLVPEGFSPSLLTLPFDANPIAGRTTNIPMSATRVTLPARVDKDHSSSVSGGLSVGRNAELVALTASRQQFEQVTLAVDTLGGLSYASEDVLHDSAVSFIAILEQGFRDEFGSKILDELLNGTGVGQFLGVINSPCLISVSKETGQAADTILYENVVNMRARCWGYSNAVWLANHDCLPQFMQMSQSVGTAGFPIWQPSAREDHPDTLLGRPVYFTEHVKTVGDKGDLVLGNWSQYLEGTYQPLQSAESIHVRFEYNERAFRFTLRNAGAPWWNSALTPKNGATLSPFVTLNARA